MHVLVHELGFELVIGMNYSLGKTCALIFINQINQ